jgi:hypothetical protein
VAGAGELFQELRMRLNEGSERGALAWYWYINKDADSERNGFAWYYVLHALRRV